MSAKQQYAQFCAEHTDIPIFSQPWWLDAVCPEQWDVILIERNDKIIASFPYYKTKIKRIFTHIGMPPLTQKLGPYIVYDSNKKSENKKIGYEHEIYNEIIDRLPKSDSFTINFDWKYKNWLAFYWRRFKQTTRYTYMLATIADHDQLMKNYAKSKKQPVQKAGEKFRINFDLSKDAFYSYFTEVVHERGDVIGFSKDFFSRLYDAIYEQKSGRTFYCTDAENNIHAINITVWDSECAYYLMAMRKKEYNTSGGTEFLVDEVIKYVSQFVDRFDFEGSMIHGVEESYRHYGTRQTEYYTISKINNVALGVYRTISSKY
ncbi:hypothetical protein AGMMS49579_25730 [Spirochaetia bacterium]|nr:hypothetical protein AGMMS49579_25730 [Spirochaetia bacterium]